ncbi:hypothetical protein [Estrella lausannensis]|uniref:Uncharacterized protein n=1 Tax=Estrella lausannensis TaxID=483423 RepID=A0A0H5DPK2_9BACT|nr:hypothetical protein [Estrella lausannensis]CRX37404.1 hypothetical protein ELAC_0040 [Estrella lausannensis]
MKRTLLFSLAAVLVQACPCFPEVVTLTPFKEVVGCLEEIPEDEIADRDREYRPSFYDELRIEREWRERRGRGRAMRESEPRPRASSSKSRRYERS